MRFVLAAVLLLIATGQLVRAQTAETFEAAILRPSPDGAPFSSTLDTSQFICRHQTLMILIQEAYPEIVAWRVSGGPGWLMSDFWDLTAKLPPGMPADQEHLNHRTEAMLQTFLAEQFKLKVHQEKKDVAVYGLVVAKSGSKLKASQADKFSLNAAPGRYEFHHQSMEGLAAYLYSPYLPQGSARQIADRPVLNMTGLQGFFDFTLEWAPETGQADPAANATSIFASLEQLGLKMQPQKSAMDFMVIEHAERPAGNR